MEGKELKFFISVLLIVAIIAFIFTTLTALAIN